MPKPPHALAVRDAARLRAAFEAWCTHQRQLGRLRRDASVKVYRAMWDALADGCARQPGGVALQVLDAGRLQRYLASRHGMAGPDLALTPRYRLRLLSLVRRVQAHDLAQQDPLAIALSPEHQVHRLRGAAALAWSEANLAAGPGVAMAPAEAPISLSAAAIDSVLMWLARLDPARANQRWQAQRDRCALALQLGAGIGPGDLRALRLVDVLPPAAHPPGIPTAPATTGHAGGWRLQVPGNGNAPAYLAPVAAWAAAALQQWLHCRQAQALPGPWLLPSTRSGKPWGKVAQYSAARLGLASAGVADGPGGSFRLRHSFALRQLVHGHASDTVAAWLGVSDPAVMQRYRQALAAALIDHAAHGRHLAVADVDADPDGAPAPPWPV